MRIIGVDPGLNHTGFGIIDVQGDRLVRIAEGVINAPPQGTLAERLHYIYKHLAEVLEKHKPHAAAIEEVFVNTNPRGTLLLGQARGAAICALVNAGLSVNEHTALQIKKSVTGHGRASKEQIQWMVATLLKIDASVKLASDAADALACAICDAHIRRMAVHVAKSDITVHQTPVQRKRSRKAWTNFIQSNGSK